MARILIVDDEQSDRIRGKAILENAGHEILVAEDGKEALNVCGETDIDVVVTDLQMPQLDGLELIRALQRASPRPTLIAVSGAGLVQLSKALVAGADATLTKPVDPQELLAAIAHIDSDAG